MRPAIAILALVVAAAAFGAPQQGTGLGIGARKAPLESYEWIAVAPVVVGVSSLGENGKLFEVEVTHVIRGDVEVGEMLRVDVKHANRNRVSAVHPRGLKLPAGEAYLLLLEKAPAGARKLPHYRLVRGVDGARELPLEGAERVVAPLREMARIQDLGDDGMRWRAIEELLESDSTTLIDTALQQTLKFSRVRPETGELVRPLLFHPEADIRRQAAEVLRLIVRRHGEDALASRDALRNELVATARRDPSVEVRVAATETIAAFSDAGVRDVLDEIAESDPEQLVRYAAEKMLLERERSPSN